MRGDIDKSASKGDNEDDTDSWFLGKEMENKKKREEDEEDEEDEEEEEEE